MKTYISGIIIALVVISGGVYFYKTNLKNSGQVACTMEAKICPDGSAVGRIGPNCEFAACPAASGNGTLDGVMTIGPICPVERIDNPCKPTAEMFAARKVFIYSPDKKTLMMTLTPDAEGKFTAKLVAGDYWIDMVHQGIGATKGVPTIINIKAGGTTSIVINVDTGIR